MSTQVERIIGLFDRMSQLAEYLGTLLPYLGTTTTIFLYLHIEKEFKLKFC